MATELQPDVLVAREEDLTEKLLPVAPVLAVEVLSPSSVINDLNNKKAAYERMGAASYWVVDPQAPSITVFELSDGHYELTAEVKDTDVLSVTSPFRCGSCRGNCSARWPYRSLPSKTGPLASSVWT